MGLVGGKRHPEIVKLFDEIVQRGSQETEDQFRIHLNDVVRMVELDKNYSTNSKLQIYELLSQLSNCTPKERERYAKKLRKVLK